MNSLFWITDFVASYIEGLMSIIFCATFIDREVFKEKKLLILIIPIVTSIVIIFLNLIEIFSIVNSVVAIFVWIIGNCVVIRKKYISVALLGIVFSVIITAIDFSIASATAAIVGSEIADIISEQNFVRFYCTLLAKSFLILIIIGINRLTLRNKPVLKKYMAIMFVCSLFLLTSNFALIKLYIDNPQSNVSNFAVLYFFSSLVVIAFMLYFTVKLSDNYEKQQTMELVEMQNKMLKKSLDQSKQSFKLWQKSIHDYKNNIVALQAIANKGEIDKIKNFLNDQSKFISDDLYYVKTGNSAVDAIIYFKQKKCEDNNINIIINLSFPPHCQISDIDLSSIIGNLLDNSIEASLKEDEPLIIFNVKPKKNFLFIYVENKYTKKELNFSLTSKQSINFHGIGLKSIQNTVEKYNGEFEITRESGKVCATVLLPN